MSACLRSDWVPFPGSLQLVCLSVWRSIAHSSHTNLMRRTRRTSSLALCLHRWMSGEERRMWEEASPETNFSWSQSITHNADRECVAVVTCLFLFPFLFFFLAFLLFLFPFIYLFLFFFILFFLFFFAILLFFWLDWFCFFCFFSSTSLLLLLSWFPLVFTFLSFRNLSCHGACCCCWSQFCYQLDLYFYCWFDLAASLTWTWLLGFRSFFMCFDSCNHFCYLACSWN